MSANAPQASASASPVIKIKADLQQIELLKPKSGDLCPSVGQTALFVGRTDTGVHIAATAERYCSATLCFLPVTWLYGVLFSLWYGLFAGSCRQAEAEGSAAFITADELEIVKFEHTCGCCGGAERRQRIPLLSIVRVVSDEVWWARREERKQTPCCAKRSSGADRMVLGVFHRPLKQDLSGLRTSSVFFEFWYGLEDAYTFQRSLQAAVFKRQRGAAEAGMFVADELLSAVSAVPDPSEEEAPLRHLVHPIDAKTFRTERQVEGNVMATTQMERFPSTVEDTMLQQKQEAAYAGVTLEKLRLNV